VVTISFYQPGTVEGSQMAAGSKNMKIRHYRLPITSLPLQTFPYHVKSPLVSN
jgi:hypothetical protein